MNYFDAYQSFERRVSRGEFDAPKNPKKPKKDQPAKPGAEQKADVSAAPAENIPAAEQDAATRESGSAVDTARNAVVKPVAQLLGNILSRIEPGQATQAPAVSHQESMPQVHAVAPQVQAAPQVPPFVPQVEPRVEVPPPAPRTVETKVVEPARAPVEAAQPEQEVQKPRNPEIDAVLHQFLVELGDDLVTTFVAGTEGDIIADESNDPYFNSRIAAASIPLILQLAARAGNKVGLGQVDNNTTSTDKVSIIARFLGDSTYCWGVVVLRNSPLGYVRKIMNEYADKLSTLIVKFAKAT